MVDATATYLSHNWKLLRRPARDRGGMALVKDLFTGNAGKLLAIGAAAVVLPTVFPGFAPPLRAALTAGLRLFADAESDAEGDLVAQLVNTTIGALLATLSGPGPGTEAQKHAALRATVTRFHAVARHRARRHARDAADQGGRYRRHVAHLERALAAAGRSRPAADQATLRHLSTLVAAA